MYSVVKINEDKIYMINDDGKMFKTDIVNANWNVQVGDVIAIHNIDNQIILTQINKPTDTKKKTKNHAGFIKACKKVLLPIFSILFALSLIAYIVIMVLPHGKTYKCSIEKENGDYYKAEMKFGKNEIEYHIDSVVTMDIPNSNSEFFNESQIIRLNETQKYKYKIVGKQLYLFYDEDGAYVKLGKISSTKIVAEATYDEDADLSAAMFFEEHTMQTLKTLSLVLFIVFAVLDLACFVVVVLNKKGIIKTANASENTTQLNSNNSNVSHTTENLTENLNAIEETQNKLEEKVEVPKE